MPTNARVPQNTSTYPMSDVTKHEGLTNSMSNNTNDKDWKKSDSRLPFSPDRCFDARRPTNTNCCAARMAETSMESRETVKTATASMTRPIMTSAVIMSTANCPRSPASHALHRPSSL